MIDINKIRIYLEIQFEQNISSTNVTAGSRKNTVLFNFPITGTVNQISLEVSVSKLDKVTTEDVIKYFIKPQVQKIKGEHNV